MNPVLLFKKGITQVTHVLLRERLLACSSHASVQSTLLARAYSKNLTPAIYSWVCCGWHGFGEIAIKTRKLNDFKLMLPFPTDSSITDLSSKTEAEILNLLLTF